MSLYKLIAVILITTPLLIGCQSDNSKQDHHLNKPSSTIKRLNERAPNPTVTLHRPFDFPLVLSGNFGELRPNHFHSGIDFKTQGETGKPVHCAEDGYVSQISVSGGGYGRAIYVTHPNIGLTTVYAHLEKFATKIDTIVEAEQYRRETFTLNIKFPIDSLPVTKGEIIALSGNSGHSFGPHLHMEVRHTTSGDALDPLPYFKSQIIDSVSPTVYNISLYPLKNEGLVNNKSIPTRVPITTDSIPSFSAWGKVYPGIRANDFMSNTHNIFGVKHLILKLDEQEVYRRTIDRFQFNATRAINTLIDYPYLEESGRWDMITRIPKLNPLGCMVESTLPNGIINIDEERVYNCEYILLDEHGNIKNVPFIITGIKNHIDKTMPKGILVKHDTINTFSFDGLDLRFFSNCFYEDTHIEISKNAPNSSFNSAIYHIKSNGAPIAKPYRLSINIDKDSISNKHKYCIVRINKNRKTRIRSHFIDGKMIAYVNQLGSFGVTSDTTPPLISALNKLTWKKTGRIAFKITDNLSGIKHYRGEIDGKWVMFELDSKNDLVYYNPTTKHLNRNSNHIIKFTVTDNCDNTNTVTLNFYW